MLKTGIQFCKDQGLPELKEGETGWNGEVFYKINLPMVVACYNCGMTMTIISRNVRVQDDNIFWCKDCCPEKDENVGGDDANAEIQ